MHNRHIAITGPTAGIGRATALELGRRGARLTLLCRDQRKAGEIQAEIVAAGGIAPDIVHMDMNHLASVRDAATQMLAADRPLDVLINNAGVINTVRRESADGYEQTLAVNHFAPFLLTGLLLPALARAPAGRIVNVASGAHAFVRDMGFDDLQAERRYSTFGVYGRSKLANILFTRALARRLAGSALTVNCLHPGAVATSLGAQNQGAINRWVPRLLKPFFRTPEQGARTSIYLSTSEDVTGVSGAYFVNCRERAPTRAARDDAAAERLWAISERAVDFHYPR